MAEPFKRGFKAACEQIALETRAELGIEVDGALSAAALAGHLSIMVMPITKLVDFGASAGEIRLLLGSGRGLSAFTVVSGTYRAIFYNPAHPPSRQANSLAHEVSHILLEHPPSVAIAAGQRNWNQTQEAEADWLAATLLVPRDGAFRWLYRGGGFGDGAEHFQVSESLFRWRANQTGVSRQLRLTG